MLGSGARTAPRDPSERSADKPVCLPVRISCTVPLTTMLIFLLFTLTSPAPRILRNTAPHPAEMEPQHFIASVPFADLVDSMEGLKRQHEGLKLTAASQERQNDQTARDNMLRVARRLRRVLDNLHATFPDDATWEDADHLNLSDHTILQQGLVLSFQGSLIFKLNKLKMMIEQFEQKPHGDPYYEAVGVHGVS